MIVISVMFGACLGFVALACAVMAKGDAADQRYSDRAELEFVREWRAARRSKRGVMTHDQSGHHWTAVRHRVPSL
jgi:hypothetical protein